MNISKIKPKESSSSLISVAGIESTCHQTPINLEQVKANRTKTIGYHNHRKVNS